MLLDKVREAPRSSNRSTTDVGQDSFEQTSLQEPSFNWRWAI